MESSKGPTDIDRLLDCVEDLTRTREIKSKLKCKSGGIFLITSKLFFLLNYI